MVATVDNTSSTIQEELPKKFGILSCINEFSNCIPERNCLRITNFRP